MVLLKPFLLAKILITITIGQCDGSIWQKFFQHRKSDIENTFNYDEWEMGFPKIAGGGNTPIEEAPYTVLIRINSTKICGGSIVSSNWILTAAHCVIGVPVSSLTVRAGTSTLDSGGVLLNVEDVKIHALYNTTSYDFDYALIKLNGSLSLTTNNTTMLKINLPGLQSYLPILGRLFVTGWGLTTSNSTELSSNMKGVRVPIINKNFCQIFFKNFTITDNMFCGGLPLFGGKGACQGDDGGPVIYNRVAVGIVTVGGYCGDPWKPSIFARTSTVSGWIKGVAS